MESLMETRRLAKGHEMSSGGVEGRVGCPCLALLTMCDLDF